MTNISKLFKAGLLFGILMLFPTIVFSQNSYPIHTTVQVSSPYSLHLSDYYNGSRDRLIVTLLNRDMDQPTLRVKLKVVIKNGNSFTISSRDELNYPALTLDRGVPVRLTSLDLVAYLAPNKIAMTGSLKDGKLPSGMTEFRVQAIDYATGRALSEFGVGRAWLELKQPPQLNLPTKDELVALLDPQYIRFQWLPRHQGLASTQYEFVLRELPDNGAAPQSAFGYGNEIFRTTTKFTTLNYTHLEPLLTPGRRYGWQVRAMAMDGVDEIGMFENNGYSEIGWFTLSDNCPPPIRVTAEAGYRKMSLKWDEDPKQQAFVVEYRPKSEHELYEWESAQTYENSFTAYNLTPGWTYEYRVGAMCTLLSPVFSAVGELTLPMDNEDRMAQCGMVPLVALENQAPNENLQAGDVVIIGGDFPMTVTQANSQGNGWYSGKGKLTFPWVFEVGIAVQFNRLRVNTDNYQIDGAVESEYDPECKGIFNTNELDGGGGRTTAAGVVFETVVVDFTIPEMPVGEYDSDSGILTIYDESGTEVGTVNVPKNEGKSIFPMIIEDADGNRYQVDGPNDDDGNTDEDGVAKSGGTKPVEITKIEGVGGEFDTDGLTSGNDVTIRFAKGAGKYAFDTGAEQWYKGCVLLRSYYEEFGKGYVAPWKLIPAGSKDVVEAYISAGKADAEKIKFVLADGTGVVAKLDGDKWVLTLPAVGNGETYEVFALYQKGKNKLQTVGKLNVVSYRVKEHTITLVPVNSDKSALDASAVERELNTIYAPYGVKIKVRSDESIYGRHDWDEDGDAKLNLNGSGFFSNETPEMKALRKLYQDEASSYRKDAYYIFLVAGAVAGDEPDSQQAVQGDMPRSKQFGYVFPSNIGRDAVSQARLIAHELGHGIFTLSHTFDNNYSGEKHKYQTANLMDYANGTELAVWQWNIMANPAPLTWFDNEEDGMALALYDCALYVGDIPPHFGEWPLDDDKGEFGSYYVTRLFDESGNTLGYTAGRDKGYGNNRNFRLEWFMANDDDLALFKENLLLFSLIGDASYSRGDFSEAHLELYTNEPLSEESKAAIRTLWEETDKLEMGIHSVAMIASSLPMKKPQPPVTTKVPYKYADLKCFKDGNVQLNYKGNTIKLRIPRQISNNSNPNIFSELGLKDGMKISSSKALEIGQKFLGEGYKELVPGSGRYVSSDGMRVFRMGNSDITGTHGGGSHVNFEILKPNPAKPGKMIVDKNYHIYLID